MALQRFYDKHIARALQAGRAGRAAPVERLARMGADAANDFGMSMREPSVSSASAVVRLGLPTP